jgi:hypothetical protein
MTSPLEAGGLVVDIGGGLTLASAFALKGPGAWWTETRSYLGWNGPLLVSAAKQTADAWVGGFLLSVGFTGQLVVSLGADPSWASLGLTLSVAVIITLASWLALWRFLRPFNLRRVLAYALAHLWPEYERDYHTHEEAVRSWWQALEGMARLAGVERRVDEAPDVFARRFFGDRRLRRMAAPPPPA